MTALAVDTRELQARREARLRELDDVASGQVKLDTDQLEELLRVTGKTESDLQAAASIHRQTAEHQAACREGIAADADLAAFQAKVKADVEKDREIIRQVEERNLVRSQEENRLVAIVRRGKDSRRWLTANLPPKLKAQQIELQAEQQSLNVERGELREGLGILRAKIAELRREQLAGHYDYSSDIATATQMESAQLAEIETADAKLAAVQAKLKSVIDEALGIVA